MNHERGGAIRSKPALIASRDEIDDGG